VPKRTKTPGQDKVSVSKDFLAGVVSSMEWLFSLIDPTTLTGLDESEKAALDNAQNDLDDLRQLIGEGG
jgi:hypothetical protein